MRRSMLRRRLRHRRARRGVALLEAMIALTILATAILTAGRYFTTLARGVADERTRAQALHLVSERFEQIRTAPSYDAIESLYAGIETNIAGYSGFSRVTSVTQVGGQPADSMNYKVITVTVTTPAIPKAVTVQKSTVVADY
ncbi:MAG TPA: hypothetical protein VF178_00705 [Gemmatimonadaceae bacterium]